MKYLDWQQISPFTPCTTIEDMDMNIIWYSNPEFTEERPMYMFHGLDIHHLFTNARVKCCSTGMVEAGIHKDAWKKVFKISANNFNLSGLNLALVEDLVDRQSNAQEKC